jgi:hypothetical protein
MAPVQADRLSPIELARHFKTEPFETVVFSFGIMIMIFYLLTCMLHFSQEFESWWNFSGHLRPHLWSIFLADIP